MPIEFTILFIELSTKSYSVYLIIKSSRFGRKQKKKKKTTLRLIFAILNCPVKSSYSIK